MKTALMVAEKPSLAAALANILSNGKNSTRKGTKNFDIQLKSKLVKRSLTRQNLSCLL